MAVANSTDSSYPTSVDTFQVVTDSDSFGGSTHIDHHAKLAAAVIATQTEADGKADAFTPVAFLDDPSGSATDQDDEARAAIVAIRDHLVTLGLMEADTP